MKFLTLTFLLLLTSVFAAGQSNNNTSNNNLVKFDQIRSAIPRGQIDTISYNSKTVGVTRKALVYKPPGYSKSKKYPVLYLLHGIGGDEYEWLRNGSPHVILDNLYADNKIEPMLVVLPNGRAMPDDRATGNVMAPDKVEAFATFEKDLLNDLIPFIEKKYPVKKDKDSRALFGLSMGGGQALNFGLSNLNTFSYVGGFSSAPNTRMPEQLFANLEDVKSKLKLLWISCGNQDWLLDISKRTHEYLRKHNVPHAYYLEPGGHDFEVWKNDLYQVAPLLFRDVDYRQLQDISTAGIPSETNVRNAQYPQILPNGRAQFQVKAPQAQKIQLDLGKKYDMVKDNNGVWTVKTDSLGEGFHYYSLLIDGMAIADPATRSYYGMGRMASGIEVPFSGGEYYALKNVPRGEVRIKRYFSPVYRAWRQCYVYVPAGYDRSTEKLPVLYLLHGGGEDETGWVNQGKTDLIMDNLIAEKKAKPMIIVMMDGNMTGARSFSEAGLQTFERELTEVVMPYVTSEFRIDTRPEKTALAGLSMGGLQTLYAGIKNTEKIHYLGVFSSGWFANDQTISKPQYEYMRSNKEAINKNLKHLWVAMGGKEDIAHTNCQVMLSEFDKMGVKYTYSEYPGGHTWPVWRNNLYNFAQLLF